METISTLVETIANYGIMVVLSAVLIIICIMMFKKQQEILNKALKVITEGSSKKEHPDSEDSEVLDVINAKMQEELATVLNILACDRSYVYLYHNGGVSSSGLFFQRMSSVCEVVSQGIAPMSQLDQNLHKGSFSALCMSLKNTGEWVVEDKEELRHHDEFLYQRMVARHAASTYILSLRDSRDNTIGFVGVDYCNLNDTVDYSTTIKKALKVASNKISSLVDIKAEFTA